MFRFARRARAWRVAAVFAAPACACAQDDAPMAAADDEPSAYVVETVAEGLSHPWSVAFLPDGAMLVTERDGRLREISPDGRLGPPIEGVPPVRNARQGGLFDVVLAPDFAASRVIYLTYAHGTRAANATRAARARYVDGRLEDLEVIFEAAPLKQADAHFGGRMAFLPDGTLLLTVGEGYDYREQAQRLESHLGSVVRLNRDGSAPPDNPFVDTAGARPEIWTYGHRNPQGILVDPRDGTVWEHEHGPRGGDEINVLTPGENYGWPVATRGIDYNGARISPYESYEGMVDPALSWTPSIAPSGFTLYLGARFPQWTGDLFVSALAGRHVRRVDLEDGEIVGEEVLFDELGERIRDVRAGPDGALYLLTDNPEGRVLRVVPAR